MVSMLSRGDGSGGGRAQAHEFYSIYKTNKTAVYHNISTSYRTKLVFTAANYGKSVVFGSLG